MTAAHLNCPACRGTGSLDGLRCPLCAGRGWSTRTCHGTGAITVLDRAGSAPPKRRRFVADCLGCRDCRAGEGLHLPPPWHGTTDQEDPR